MLDSIRKYHEGGRNNKLVLRAVLIVLVLVTGFLLIYRLLGRL